MKQLHDLDVEDYLAECINIADHDLDGEMRRVAADLAYWNKKYADAINDELSKKLRAKVAATRARNRAEAYLTDKKAKTTDAAIAAQAELDDEWTITRVEANRAEAFTIEMKGYVASVVAKKDMLMSLGAKQRLELKGEARIKEPEPESF